MSDNLKTRFPACGIRFLYVSLVNHNHIMYLFFQAQANNLYLQKAFTSAPKKSLLPLLWLSMHFVSHDVPWIQSLQSNLAAEIILSDEVVT